MVSINGYFRKEFIKHIEFFCSINNIEISGIRNVASYTSCYINGDGCDIDPLWDYITQLEKNRKDNIWYNKLLKNNMKSTVDINQINIMVRKNQTEYFMYGKLLLHNFLYSLDETYKNFRNNCITIDCSNPCDTNEFIHINVMNIEKLENNVLTFKDGMTWDLKDDALNFSYNYRQYKLKQLI